MQYKIGQKVQYLDDKGEWRPGVVHAVNSHETAAGVITGVSYLVDTGKDTNVLESPEFDSKGKLKKVHKHRQPEQILVAEDQIKTR